MSKFGEVSLSSTGELLARVAELAAGLRQDEAPELESVLDELTESAARAVPGAEYAGITVTRRRSDVRTASATGRYPVMLDEIQRRHRQGPCVSAAWQHHSVRIDDLTNDDRWFLYRRDATAQTPIRSILSFPLFGDTSTMGALNFYAEHAHAFNDEAVELGLVFATHTALVWNMLRRDEQFRSALASRDIIGQAKGMLMERFTMDAVAAFNLLKRLSQESNTPLAQLAQRLIDAEHPSR